MIPILDLGGEGLELREACETWGCFRIFNHGVPLELMAEMKSLAADIFDLPDEIKRRNRDIVVPGSGYVGPSTTNPHHEALGVFDVGSSHALDEFCSQLQLSSLQRNIIEKYAEAIYNVLMDVASKLAKSIGSHGDHLFEGWARQFKINRYSFSPETLDSLGLQAHTDSCFLTVLQDDDYVAGLEVTDQSGEFVAVDPSPGTLIVNLGDVGTAWSNGRVRNVLHRVRCKEGSKRYSIATFFSPQTDMVVEAPEEFINAENPRLYSPVTYEEIRILRAKNRLHAGEVLDLIRVKN